MEIDYIIQPRGVSIFSPRLKNGERFVGFDKNMEFEQNSFIRIRARNKMLNLPLNHFETHQSTNEMQQPAENKKEMQENEKENNEGNDG